jgi:hypothetical protein
LGGHRHQSVFHGILMHAIQPCQLRPLVRELCFPKIKPHLSCGCFVEIVHPSGGFDM